jgi:hypothetical protein
MKMGVSMENALGMYREKKRLMGGMMVGCSFR